MTLATKEIICDGEGMPIIFLTNTNIQEKCVVFAELRRNKIFRSDFAGASYYFTRGVSMK